MIEELRDQDLEQVVGGRVTEAIQGSKNTFPGVSKKSDAPYELVLE